jgi:hypothetical protein
MEVTLTIHSMDGKPLKSTSILTKAAFRRLVIEPTSNLVAICTSSGNAPESQEGDGPDFYGELRRWNHPIANTMPDNQVPDQISIWDVKQDLTWNVGISQDMNCPMIVRAVLLLRNSVFNPFF